MADDSSQAPPEVKGEDRALLHDIINRNTSNETTPRECADPDHKSQDSPSSDSEYVWINENEVPELASGEVINIQTQSYVTWLNPVGHLSLSEGLSYVASFFHGVSAVAQEWTSTTWSDMEERFEKWLEDKGLQLSFELKEGTVTFGRGQIDEERSYFLLQSTEARARVSLGETLVYTFCIVLNITNTAVDTMSVFLNGSNLLVQGTSDLLETNFTWVNMDGQPVRDVETPTYEVETFKETSLRPSSELDMIFPLTVETLRLQKVSGTLRLHVPENAELGTILRPVMYISSLDKEKLLYETFIFGDYAFVHLPDLTVNQEQPHFLGRKQRSKITSQLVVTAGTLGSSFLNIYMPNNFTLATDDVSLNNGEPFVTLKDFQVVGNTGVMDETIAIITKTTRFPILHPFLRNRSVIIQSARHRTDSKYFY